MSVTINQKPQQQIIKIMGIDPSTHTGLVSVMMGTDWVRCEHSAEEHFPPMKGFDRHAEYFEETQGAISQWEPNLIVVEGYAHNSKFNNTTQTELGAIVRTVAALGKYKAIQVSPTTLKKFVTGKGNANKALMMKEVYKRWGFEGTDNECDAYALAMFGCELNNPGVLQMPKVNQQAIADWIKNNQKLGKKKFTFMVLPS